MSAGDGQNTVIGRQQLSDGTVEFTEYYTLCHRQQLVQSFSVVAEVPKGLERVIPQAKKYVRNKLVKM
jgi:hypothetical protein